MDIKKSKCFSPYLPACPKCKQKIGCGKDSCIDWHGLHRFRAIFTTKCKKCGFNLNETKERK